jgi:glycosyltransferase involved in cell wall biosynthesis
VLTKRQYTGKDLLDDRFGRLRELPLALAELGHTVHGFCLSYRRREEGPLRDGSAAGWVTWHRINLGRLVWPAVSRYSALIARLARTSEPDVIWACSDAFHVILGGWVASRLGRPYVVDLYDDFESFGATKLLGVIPLFRRAVAAAQGVSCVSQPLAEKVRSEYRYRGPVAVVENATRLDMFRPLERSGCRRALGLPAGVPIVGTAGALDSNRGVELLFEAFRRLQREHSQLQLALAGPRNVAIPCSPGIHDLGVLALQRVPVFLNALDIAVVCNRNSDFARYCFPQKFCEIVACRVPVVVSAVGMVADLLAGQRHCLFQPESIDSLVHALRAQLASPRAAEFRVPHWQEVAVKLERLLAGAGCATPVIPVRSSAPLTD